MKNLLKACLALAMAASLVACGGEKAPTIAKFGLGTVSTYENGQVNTTMAAVGLDSEGKIVYVDIDVAQSTFADAAKAKTQTKEELKEAYNMKGVSAQMGVIAGGAEWYEQAEFLEKYVLNKTAGEVAAIETKERDASHTTVPAGADLTAGCTMNIGEFKDAIAKACANARTVAAETVKFGRVMENGSDLSTTMVVYALDKDGKVVDSILDVAQIKEGTLLTKAERKEDYGMKQVSGFQGNIEGGAEWYEQAAAWEKWTVGKTLDEIAGVKTKLNASNYTVADDADLFAGCTMQITSFVEATKKAK
jgi:hypothetical protein